MIKKSFATIVFFLSISFQTVNYGQILPFQNYSIKDGLISVNVHSLCEDSLGYIWIGTEEGISVFNSREFINYTTANGLSADNISCITADSKEKGKVWIATYGNGIDVYENGKFEKAVSKLPARLKNVNVMLNDKDNILWCGTDSGLFYLTNDTVHSLNDITLNEPVNTMASDGKNNLWIGTAHGLYVLNKKKKLLSSINLPSGAENSGINCLVYSGGYFWAAGFTGTLLKLNRQKKIISTFQLHFEPFSMTADNSGNIWIGSGHGLYKLSADSTTENIFKKIKMGNNSDHNIITSILFDRENILWCGSNVSGISKLIYQNFYRIPIPSNLPIDYWSCTVTDKNNHFWVAINNTLFELWADRSKLWHWSKHKIKTTFPKEHIQKIYCDSQNNIFIAYLKGIINVFSIANKDPLLRSSNLIFKKNISLLNTAKYYGLYTFLIDKKGYLWCSLLDSGVAIWNIEKKKLIKLYNDKSGMPDNSVRAIYEDSNGNFWFGGYDKGLSEFSKDKVNREVYNLSGNNSFIRHFSTANGLPDNHVRTIREYNDKEIIIGTRYGGIAYINGENIKSVDRNEGLISNGIWDMTRDPDNNIWFCTQSGIQEINNKNKIINFLFIDDIPRIPYYSICSSLNGEICFTDNKDIYLYRPITTPAYTETLPIYINHILINGQERELNNSFFLPSFNNTITFEFICVTNKEEKNIHYLYRLLQSNKNWTPIKGKPSVTFASLRPGNYTFQVLAQDSRNIKSLLPAKVDFVIEAPFYLHWWFISIILIFVITGIIATSKLRFKRLLEIEKIRTRIAADLHDEIGSGLTRIAILSEHALLEGKQFNETVEENKDKYSKQVSIERVGKISRNLVDSMIDVIWSIDPKYDSLNDFIFNFKTFANEVCEAKNIKLIIETENILNVKVNAQIKRSLQLISKEALNNSLKYSCCKNVKYSLAVRNKNIHLVLEDDGIGFDLDKVKRGHGLANISKHAKELTGVCNLITSPGNGTKISILFPIKS